MSYRISKEALVPLLCRCLIRHGTLQAIKDYPSKVSENGGDATVCDEFIVMNEIGRYDDCEELIRESYEKVILSVRGALDKADSEIQALKAEQPSKQKSVSSNLFEAWWKYLIPWALIVGAAAWMDEEGISATLASSVVISGTGFLCFFAYMKFTGKLNPK